MTNEWIDWTDARLRVPLRMTGHPYPPQSYYTTNNSNNNKNNNTSNSNSNNSNNNSTCNSLNTSTITTTCNSNNNNYLSCFTKNKFHFKSHKIQQLYTTTHGKLKGN